MALAEFIFLSLFCFTYMIFFSLLAMKTSEKTYQANDVMVFIYYKSDMKFVNVTCKLISYP